MIAGSPARRRQFAAVASVLLSAVLLLGCIPGPDDASTDSGGDPGGEVSSDQAHTTETTENSSATTEPSTTTTTEVPVEVDPEPDAYISTFDPDGGSDLYRLIDDRVEPVTALSLSGGPVQLTDLALSPSGVLYGSTFSELVRIDTRSGEVEVVAPFDQDPVNALTFMPDGRLLAADLGGRVSVVDVETGAAETMAIYPAGLLSSGDLVVTADGTVLATATDDVSEYLLTIDPDSGDVEILTSRLPPAVYGLTFASDGALLGWTFVSSDCERGEMIVISVADRDDIGYGSRGCLDFAPGGAAGG